MTSFDGGDVPAPRRRASVEVLRAEAADELGVVIHERLRHGEDPWAFMEELPTIDELVVLTLRAEAIAAVGRIAVNAVQHDRLLRRIAMDYPPLTATVWHMLGETNTHRSWDAVVAVDSDVR